MITLRQLQFALAVLRHRHFKRAAEECGVSQSALSLGIAELEKILGVTLFERNNKQVIITPIGEEILERAQKIYLDAQQLTECAQASNNHLGFAMNIGFIPTIAPYLLPKILPALRKSYPDFVLNISEDTTANLLKALSSGKIDAAVLALPYDLSGLEVIEFAKENFFAIVHRNHPLSQQKRISTEALKSKDLLLLGEGHCLRDQIIDLCEFHNHINDNCFKNASLNTLIQLAVNDMGMTLIPEMAKEQISKNDQAHILPLEIKGPHRTLAIATRTQYPRKQELQLLARLFAQTLDQG